MSFIRVINLNLWNQCYMFTGIVRAVVTVSAYGRQADDARLAVALSKRSTFRCVLGSSVSVNGVCLTVSKKKGNELWFDVMGETIKKTTLGSWGVGTKVNLEPSLRLGDEVGGHFVFGHVDLKTKVKSLKSKVKSCELTFELPKKVKRYIVPQGSVAINGVSLTVAKVGKNDFSVSLVEYTWHHTTLGDLQKGDVVNVECDMLAKYARVRN